MYKLISCLLIISGLFIFNSCKKNKRPPLVTTSAINAGILNAQVAGVLYDEGSSKVTEKGICWGTQKNVSIDNNKIISTTGGTNFTEQLNGLEDNRIYYVRAYAINSFGVSYGREMSFTTQSNALPDMDLFLSSTPGPTTASIRLYLEQYSTATYTTGLCWSTIPMPTVSSNTMLVTQITQSNPWNYSNNFYLTLQNLQVTSVYYVRAFSTNGVTTKYSDQLKFTTEHSVDIAYLNSRSFTSASLTSTLTGNINYTSITAVGVCWSTSPLPTISNSKSEQAYSPSYTRTLTLLTAGTTYYVRAYVKTASATYYSPQKVLNTFNSTVTDIDGNSYNTVKIGNQEWMTSNLKTTRYNTGASLQLVTNTSQWLSSASAQTPMYCYYNYQVSNNTLYGKLYPRYVAFDANIAPVGWHVATLSEWQTLFANTITADLLSGSGANFDGNYSGLSLPYGGKWDTDPASGFWFMGQGGTYWAPPSINQTNSMSANSAFNYYTGIGVNESGYSIRCVKD